MANVVKDIGEIWTRLFDHRPFLSGEIKLFLHEFEVRENDDMSLRHDLDFSPDQRFFSVITSENPTQGDKNGNDSRETEKRNNREVDALFEILQNLTEIRYSQLDKIKLGAEAHLEPLKKKVDETVSICNRIFEKEEAYKSDTTLENKRELRKVEWDKFIQDIAKKCEKVDKTFKDKEDDLQDYYFDLERKLCGSPSHSSKS